MIDQGQAKKALQKLFLSFPSGSDEDLKRAKVEAYWETLSKVQPSFLVEACQYAARGGLGKTFLPTAAELYQLAEELAARYARDHRPRIASPPESQNSYEQRERMKAGFKQLLADLAAGKTIDLGKVYEPFDPNAETFSPYKLGMSKEEITCKVAAHRSGT